MTDSKNASLKGGIPPSPPKTRLFIFTFLMAGSLVSLLGLYKIARPYLDNHGYLDLALIAGLVFTVVAYVMAVKGGIPPSPPKGTDK